MDLFDLSNANILYTEDVQARLYEVQELLLDDFPEDKEWQREDLEWELGELDRFKTELVEQGGWEHNPGLIADSYWDKWAAEDAEGIYGREAVESPYWNYEKYAEDRQENFYEIKLDGNTFWYEVY
jgi:hypothetical protein